VLFGAACSQKAPSTAVNVAGISTQDRSILDALAQQKMPTVQALLQGSDPTAYGLSGTQDIPTLILGSPIPVHGLTPSQLQAYVPGAPVRDIIGPYDQVYYPVQSGQSTRFLLMLMKGADGTSWEYYGFGRAPMAQRLDGLVSQGGALDLLFQPQAKATLGLSGAGASEQLVYVVGGPSVSPDLIGGAPQTPAAVMAQLQQAVATDLAAEAGTGP
jgi:hypothetical protein